MLVSASIIIRVKEGENACRINIHSYLICTFESMSANEEEKVILVNENDEPVGLMPKLEAHEKGVLHRAFSVFIYNDKGELLLQQRALRKYHSPGLWTNTCCSHQRSGESTLEAATRRLEEEMGFTVPLKETTSFIYEAPFDNGLTEHEYDHIVVGTYTKDPVPNPDEVAGWKWMYPEEVRKDMLSHPERYTVWFKIIFDTYYSQVEASYESDR